MGALRLGRQGSGSRRGVDQRCTLAASEQRARWREFDLGVKTGFGVWFQVEREVGVRARVELMGAMGAAKGCRPGLRGLLRLGDRRLHVLLGLVMVLACCKLGIVSPWRQTCSRSPHLKLVHVVRKFQWEKGKAQFYRRNFDLNRKLRHG